MSDITILIVDDLPDHRRPLRRRLETKLKVRVLEADGQKEAWDILQEHHQNIALVVVDLHMKTGPDEGTQLIEQIVNSGMDCRIGVRTAHGRIDDQVLKTRTPRVDFYAKKDDGIDSLLQYIQSAINSLLDLKIADHQINQKHQVLERLKESQNIRWTVLEPTTDISSDSSSQEKIAIRLFFEMCSWQSAKFSTQEGTFYKIEAEGTRQTTSVGSPALFEAIQYIALPSPTTDLTAHVVAGTEIWHPCEGKFRILPLPAPYIEGQEPTYQMNLGVYLKNQFLPEANVRIQKESIFFDGVPCASVSIIPVRHNPRVGNLEILSSVELEINGKSQPGSADQKFQPKINSPLQTIVLNWANALRGYTAKSSSRLTSMAINSEFDETTDTLKIPDLPALPTKPNYWIFGTQKGIEAIQPLLDERGKTFNVVPFILGEGRLSFSSDLSAEEKRKAIRDFLQEQSGETTKPNDRPDYVLLVGNHEVIPHFHFVEYHCLGDGTLDKKTRQEIQGIPILSDSQYTYFPEITDDPGPRFALGRLPFNDPQKLRDLCVNYVAGKFCTQLSNQWRFFVGLDHVKPNKFQRHIEDRIRPLVGNNADFLYLDSMVDPNRMVELALRNPTRFVTYRGHGSCIEWQINPSLKPTFFQTRHLSEKNYAVQGVMGIACCTNALRLHPATQVTGNSRCNLGYCNTHQEPFGYTWVKNQLSPWYLGSTSKSFSLANDVFHEELVCQLIKPSVSTIGSAFRSALIEFLKTTEMEVQPHVRDSVAMYLLIGDPAWPLQR
ncbi:MAG: response regulator [Acidobacteria bacterium]|nr:response regulator [Acidobacteriota bacterium]